MSALSRRIETLVAEGITSPRTRDLRRWIAERARRLRGEPHRVHYFHEVSDPYAHLAAQRLDALVARFDVELVPHLVGAPSDAAAPERERLVAYARSDAAAIASSHGLDFPAHAPAPDAAQREQAEAIVAHALATPDVARVAVAVGAALWRGDGAALAALAREGGSADVAATRAAREAGDRLRAARGHYSSATFFYAGEWYWGVDRLAHLERRLDALGARRPGAPAAGATPFPAPEDDAPLVPGRRATLEAFVSLRSPYSYVAMERLADLVRRLPVDLVLRPVLPMVMRGLPVPTAKRLYITLDTKREAERYGLPFGRVCDPVGRPVERGFSLYPFACAEGRGFEYLRSFLRAAFAEGTDTGTDAGLRRVAERAGLDWSRARAHLDRDGWQAELEHNRETLFGLGLWGVPSFRVPASGAEPELATWGQDRLWLVERALRRRLSAR
ncbi:MAG: DsbA family protein [Myxococcota bacterium]|nr:DsbA family protein [Myxococcota bacterium]